MIIFIFSWPFYKNITKIKLNGYKINPILHSIFYLIIPLKNIIKAVWQIIYQLLIIIISILFGNKLQKSMSRATKKQNYMNKSRQVDQNQNQLGEQLLPQQGDSKLNTSQQQVQRSKSMKLTKTTKSKEDINQNNKQQRSNENCFVKLRKKLFNEVQDSPRTIHLTGQCQPANNQTNLVKNTKYNLLTFVPKVLYNQFKFFFNMFFLITALSQLIEVFRVGLFVTFIGPLVLVLSLTMGKQAYDDYRTYLRDIEANSKIYQVIRKGNKKQKVKSKDLRVGDIVILKSGNRVPADMITLYSDDQQGTLFLKTDQLDGQTDWKLRKAVKMTQSMIKSKAQYGKIIDQNLYCTVKQPIGQIYTFDGIFKTNKNQSQSGDKQKLTLENTLWASCVLTNGQVLGLVIYIGKQTRVAMGASSPRTKMGILDHQINFLSKVLFFIMAGLTCVLLILQGTQLAYVPIQFIRILILLSSIIPISMRVNLDFAKLFYAYQINQDKYIEGTMTRNSNCPEQLGRVRYILSDKTGTLTQNQMLFRRISIEDTIKFTDENQNQMKAIIEDYENIPGKIQSKEKCLKEIITALALCHNVTPVYNDGKNQKLKSEEKNKKTKQNQQKKGNNKKKEQISMKQEHQPLQDQNQIIKKQQKQQQQMKKQKQYQEKQQNSVQRSQSQGTNNLEQRSNTNSVKDKQFQASSPDQITFVKIVQKFGIILKSRTQTDITITLPSGKQIKYEILNIFPFSSETKRMGIIVKHPQTQQITLYLKGADSIMKNYVNNRQKKGFIDQQCKDLSMTGLRTLVITKKQLKEQQYQSWSQKYQQASNKLQVDKKQIEQIMNELEKGVQFLGVTGIQDKLQNKLKQTIQSLKSANIKIWMITGDKIQTAQCISRSCGLQLASQQNIKIEEVTNASQWRSKWENVKRDLSKVLIIDGKTLTYVLEKQDADLKQRIQDFYITAMQMPSVICCRCSPQQKRTLTQGVKKYRKQKQAVLGIGDGGNDVGMIQAADVGVGIVGKQGNQAALAADFSILQFRHLKCLLLWHGRLSYKRSALLSSFIIHRGFIVSIIQIIFSCIFFYVSIPVFNSYLQLGYATIFTFWPVFSLILDEDIDKKRALKYPALYDSLQQANQLSAVNFLSWLWKASAQGTLIMILSIIFFKDNTYLQIETICFTTLIITQYCMTLSEIHHMHLLTIVCVVASLLCYLFCLFFLNNAMNLSELSLVDFLFICLITLISWGPILGWKIIRFRLFPNDYQKVMKNVKRALIQRKILKSSMQSVEEYTRQSMLNY